METLAPVKSLSGHDGYCHVCWEDFYRLWIGPEAPPNHECPLGASRATECANAMGRARFRAEVEKLKEQGLWPNAPSTPLPQPNTDHPKPA